MHAAVLQEWELVLVGAVSLTPARQGHTTQKLAPQAPAVTLNLLYWLLARDWGLRVFDAAVVEPEAHARRVLIFALHRNGLPYRDGRTGEGCDLDICRRKIWTKLLPRI